IQVSHAPTRRCRRDCGAVTAVREQPHGEDRRGEELPALLRRTGIDFGRGKPAVVVGIEPIELRGEVRALRLVGADEAIFVLVERRESDALVGGRSAGRRIRLFRRGSDLLSVERLRLVHGLGGGRRQGKCRHDCSKAKISQFHYWLLLIEKDAAGALLRKNLCVTIAAW